VEEACHLLPDPQWRIAETLGKEAFCTRGLIPRVLKRQISNFPATETRAMIRRSLNVLRVSALAANFLCGVGALDYVHSHYGAYCALGLFMLLGYSAFKLAACEWPHCPKRQAS
jgi:hypothetical protein